MAGREPFESETLDGRCEMIISKMAYSFLKPYLFFSLIALEIIALLILDPIRQIY